MTVTPKKRILVVGGGAVGTIAALNLDTSAQVDVTLVLRSNYDAVSADGFTIASCDHGRITGWRPHHVTNTVPTTTDRTTPFDYLVLATKNTPDIPPPLTDLVAPAVTPSRTAIVLLQNGLNIESPFHAAFPHTPVLSGISLVGAHQPAPGRIVQDGPDRLVISPFARSDAPSQLADDTTHAAREFVDLYAAGGRTDCAYAPDAGFHRWRKLLYNAALNPVAAVTGLDTGRLRLAPGAIDGLVRPAMEEIRAAARAVAGHDIPAAAVGEMIEVDPLEMYLEPSMLQDVAKGAFIEVENILGEPLRVGEARGVPMPTLRVLYRICQALQWRSMEARGMVEVPPKKNYTA